jgi:hypothetical protein
MNNAFDNEVKLPPTGNFTEHGGAASGIGT